MGMYSYLKVAFYQKVRFVFQISNKIFQITILNLKFEIPTYNSKFKFQAQDSGLECLFWRFEKDIFMEQ